VGALASLFRPRELGRIRGTNKNYCESLMMLAMNASRSARLRVSITSERLTLISSPHFHGFRSSSLSTMANMFSPTCAFTLTQKRSPFRSIFTHATPPSMAPPLCSPVAFADVAGVEVCIELGQREPVGVARVVCKILDDDSREASS
jgi:hypothetical protein